MFMAKTLSLFVLCIFAIILKKVHYLLYEVPSTPQLENIWWGPGNSSYEDKAIKPFVINISKEVLEDLNIRLEQVRPFTPPLQNVQHRYGINTNLLKEVVTFWKTKYNWHEREKYLNQYSQFITNIQGLNIHFLHIKPPKKTLVRITPILILHGWGGSIREFYDLIPLLISPQENKDIVFEVIIPSLPGFGFSDAAIKPGLGAIQMAVIFKNLMARLRFENYYVQGGDWGAVIASAMATLFPENVLGIHCNLCIVNTHLAQIKLWLGSLYPSFIIDKDFENKLYPLSEFYYELIIEFGYYHLQATKPDTLGIALKDSPVGLAAYFLEKFITFTNPSGRNSEDGGLTERFTYTQLLDNIMIYWVTGSITTSMRIYAESTNKEQLKLNIQRIPIEVPSACARFKHEIIYLPDWILKDRYKNLVQSNDFPVGGHFAAFEVPELLAADIWSAVEKFEIINMKAFDVY